MKFLLLFVLYFPSAFGLECKWWQIKVSEASVNNHQRQGVNVKNHPRTEHCRSKWPNADVYIKQFKDEQSISTARNKFKKWTRNEIKILLEIFSDLPRWTALENYTFVRALNSNIKGNPAASDIKSKSIIIYDQFFNENNKSSIIVHESAHHIYQNLGPAGVRKFSDLSGWDLEVDKNGKVFEIPPKSLLKPDSSVSKDEDFSNHVEEYFHNPRSHKIRYPNLHEFLKGKLE